MYPKAVILAMMLAITPLSNAQVLATQSLSGLFGFKSAPKFLPVHQAFSVSVSQEGDVLTARFGVRDGHYVYQDKLSLALPDGVIAEAWHFDKTATMIDDPEFGKVAVFEEDVVATAKLNAVRDVNDTAQLTWQGCAKAGLCYPPERVQVSVSLQANKSTKEDAQEKTPKPNDTKTKTEPIKQGLLIEDDLAKEPDVEQTLWNTSSTQLLTDEPLLPKSDTSEALLIVPSDSLVDDTMDKTEIESMPPAKHMDEPRMTHYALNHTPQNTSAVGGFGLDKNPILAVFLLFLAGIALAFTACVYPMIPIVANIVAKSHNPSAMRGFVLTGAYGLGVATSYGLLGMAVAWFGQSLGIVGWLQNPWILMAFAMFFVVLALQMWGLVRLSLPSSIKNKFAKGSQSADRHLGRVYGSFLVGALSSLVVSPCVSAPLAGALWAVSVQGNVLLGFVALFALGLGLSLPLMIIGATQGKFMPKAGKFMEDVKHFGGLMLLAVAIVLMNRVFLTSAMLVLWAVWFMMMAVFLYRLHKLPFVALGTVSGLWAVLLMAGASLGGQDAWQPLSPLVAKEAPKKADIKIHTLDELDEILVTTPKVLVDITADWCIECKIMEKTLFNHRPTALADWQVVKLDITDTTDHSRAVLGRYELFGPPALLYYQEGQLLTKQLGEVSRSDFEMALQAK